MLKRNRSIELLGHSEQQRRHNRKIQLSKLESRWMDWAEQIKVKTNYQQWGSLGQTIHAILSPKGFGNSRLQMALKMGAVRGLGMVNVWKIIYRAIRSLFSLTQRSKCHTSILEKEMELNLFGGWTKVIMATRTRCSGADVHHNGWCMILYWPVMGPISSSPRC